MAWLAAGSFGQPALPILQAPVAVVVEAQQNDIEGGLGQCAAQMVGAQLFNEREGRALPAIIGCVTTGESWQFLRLEQATLVIDTDRYYLVTTGLLLGVLAAIAACATATGG